MIRQLYLSADVLKNLVPVPDSSQCSHRVRARGLWLAGLLLTLIGPTLVPAAANAAGPTAGEQILQAVEHSLLQRVREDYAEVPPEQITTAVTVNDATANLTPCPTPILVDWRGTSLSNRLTPRVACEALGWQVYVPVELTINIPVVVTARSLSRGQRLMPADLTLAMTDISALRHGHYDNPTDLIGYEVARNLTNGTVVTPYIAKPPVMIERGDRVIIIATGTGLSVQTEGEALREGSAGQQIPVRNLTSRQTIHAYVRSRGVVEIPGR